MELSPFQLDAEWKAGKFRAVYYLFGEDPSAKAETLRHLKDRLSPGPFNFNEFTDTGADPQEIVGACLTPPAFADRRLVIVKNPKLNAETKKTLAAYLGDPLASTTLVLFSDEYKPRFDDILTAAAGSLQGVVLFKPLREEEAVAKLQDCARKAGASLDPGAAAFIVEEVGTNWGLLQTELDKLLLLAKGKSRIQREDALAALGYRQTANPFDFPRILQTRDRAKTLSLLRRLSSEGMEPLQILYKMTWTLNRQLKAKRMRAAGKSEAEIFGSLKLNKFYDKDFMRWADAVTEKGLMESLKACVVLEARLKSETWLSGGMELERLAAALCRPAGNRQAGVAAAGAAGAAGEA